jgi:hypothetical protein
VAALPPPGTQTNVPSFFASGRAEETVYFGCFGGFAAKTTEKDSHFHAAGGDKALMRPASAPTA